MADRELIKIQDLSSCDFYCSGVKLRVKRDATVIDNSGADVPAPYDSPDGTIPDNLAENAILIEIFANGVGYWLQTSCDAATYAWTSLGVVTDGAGGNLTTFQESAGNSGAAPAAPDTPPATAIEFDTLIERMDDYTNYWVYDGAAWDLVFQDSNSENYNTYFEDNSAFTVPATSADPPNPAGTNPSTNLQIGDTYVTKYSQYTVYYTYSGAAWVEDFRVINATIAGFTFSTGLTNTTGTITANISTGVSGGQTIIGGTAASNSLTISTTSHGTKGKLLIGTSAYDEVNNRLGIGTSSPTKALEVIGTDALINTLTVGKGHNSSPENTALGVSVLLLSAVGSYNTGVGYEALKTNITGTYNTAVGYKAATLGTGAYTTAIGASALATLSSGAENTAVGKDALTSLTTGSRNTVLGYKAGAYGGGSVTGSNNIFLGHSAGDNITSGSNNILLGYDIDLQSASGSNQLSIGNLIFGTGLTSTGTAASSGKIGIGLVTPTARLHLPAGTATASTAPLKLTTGTALTSTEDGALEYHTSHLYFTIGSTRYQLDQQLASANNGVSYSAGVLQFGLNSAGTGAADFTSNRYLYTGTFDFSVGGSFALATTYPIFYLSGSLGKVGIGGTTTPDATLSVTNTAGLGAAPTLTTLNAKGILATTGAIATVGAQEVSNPIRWRSSGWGTSGGAAQYVDFLSYVLPIQGTSPTGDWILQSSVNGAAYTSKLFYSSGGSLSLGTNATATAKLQVRGTVSTTTALFETSASVQLLKLTDTSNELGDATIPLTTYSTKTLCNYVFTALANSETGVNIIGTATARATASDNITGITLTPSMVSAAATQILTAFKVNGIFTDAFSATKYLVDFQTSGVSKISGSSTGSIVAADDAHINTIRVGLGNSAIATNTTVGYQTLASATVSSSANVAVGYQSLKANTDGSQNTSVGSQSLLVNTIGYSNTSVGTLSLVTNISGNYNTSVGVQSSNKIVGDGNVSVGMSALRQLSTGSNYNIGIGYYGGGGAVNTINNIGNIFIGYQTASNIDDGASNNILIGYDISLQSPTGSNQLSIGNLIFGTGLTSTGTTASTGKMGIGVVNPSARLHLAAGTATASTAPLKLTSGTSLTTAEAGALEYNGTNLFFTRSGTTRESVLSANAVNSVSPTAQNRTITVVIDGTTYYLTAKTTND